MYCHMHLKYQEGKPGSQPGPRSHKQNAYEANRAPSVAMFQRSCSGLCLHLEHCPHTVPAQKYISFVPLMCNHLWKIKLGKWDSVLLGKFFLKALKSEIIILKQPRNMFSYRSANSLGQRIQVLSSRRYWSRCSGQTEMSNRSSLVAKETGLSYHTYLWSSSLQFITVIFL